MEIHGRQGFGRWSFPLFYYAVAQTPIRALRIKHFRKAGRKNEYKKKTGRQELAETGGRIPLQGYRCTESRQPVLEELYHVYADNKGIIADGVPEIEEYMKEVLPNLREIENFKKELLEIVVDVKEFLPDAG